MDDFDWVLEGLKKKVPDSLAKRMVELLKNMLIEVDLDSKDYQNTLKEICNEQNADFDTELRKAKDMKASMKKNFH